MFGFLRRFFRSPLWKFLQPIADELARQLTAEALRLIEDYVRVAAGHPEIYTNASRHVFVRERVKRDLSKLNQSVSDSAIDLAIPAAVRRMKAGK
jgi:hypothetical protein